MRELKTKSKEELKKLYLDLCQKRQQMNFKLANKQLKNVRKYRDIKKDIARIKTLMNQKQEKPNKENK